MRRIRCLLSILVLSVLGLGAYAQSYASVQGQVLTSQNNEPIPGLTVSLVHPQLGRSVPAVTNEAGEFYFFNIPIHEDTYYIEIFWGNELVYRSSLSVNSGNISLGSISL